MESTYDMYANELRYFLVYSVFVESIEVQSYQLPFTLRTPRPVKLVDPKSMPFCVGLRKKLEKFGTTDKSKKTEKIATGKGKKKDPSAVPNTPSSSLVDEEILLEKRRFILPLIEANETMKIFDMLGRDD
ncbi:uncharacterized protein LOC116433437 isoform X1 [Nomia melanderi]|uniref:uncharacterized protein LOC116433437 isoform X1 n=1 Tax=Nomia melanderi TaxID=2448451 RepID=UPI003FCDFF2F